MTYTQSEMPTVISTNGGSNGMWGQDGIWAILLLALLGNYGFGGRGGYGIGSPTGAEALGYELGKVATTNDVASGFNNSAVLGSLNDLKLGQTSGFAGIQQTLCQGFNGVNTAMLQGFHGVDNAVCTLGYNVQQGFNSLGHQISDCCCATQRAIDSVNYNMAKSTSDLIVNQNANTQKIIDYMQSEKISALQAENLALKGQISNNAQSAYIINQVRPLPIPAFTVANPYAPVTTPTTTG